MLYCRLEVLRNAVRELAESLAPGLLWPCGRTRTLPLRVRVGLGRDRNADTQVLRGREWRISMGCRPMESFTRKGEGMDEVWKGLMTLEKEFRAHSSSLQEDKQCTKREMEGLMFEYVRNLGHLLLTLQDSLYVFAA